MPLCNSCQKDLDGGPTYKCLDCGKSFCKVCLGPRILVDGFRTYRCPNCEGDEVVISLASSRIGRKSFNNLLLEKEEFIQAAKTCRTHRRSVVKPIVPKRRKTRRNGNDTKKSSGKESSSEKEKTKSSRKEEAGGIDAQENPRKRFGD